MLSIAPFSDDWLDQYCNLYIETWKSEPYGELFCREDVLNQLSHGDQVFLLLNDADLVGFVGGRPLGRNCDFFRNEGRETLSVDNTFYISELSVKQEFRRFGFGYMLMRLAFSEAKLSGYSSFLLRTHACADNPAKSLYRKLGMNPQRNLADEILSIPVDQERIDDRPRVDERVYYLKTEKDRSELTNPLS